MNRQGPVPQSLRGGIPGQFGAQQQQPQHGARGVSNRIPNGKLGANAGWALGGVPMGNAGIGASRQHSAMNYSQPTTPLDLSEFPSLGNSASMGNPNQSTMWSTAAGSRNGGQMSRNQPPQSQQDDIYTPTSRLGQGSFRYGNPQQSQAQSGQSLAVDEFPPLSKNATGDIGQERLLSTLGFGPQGGAGGRSVSSGISNGLLSAVSSVRPAESRPSALGAPGSSRIQGTRVPVDSDSRQKPLSFRDDAQSLLSAGSDGPPNSLGAIGNDGTLSKVRDDKDRVPEFVDPLAGMSDADKWGLKGLRTLMHNYPDYNAMVTGIDPTTLGLDLTSPDLISTQHLSVFDDEPPRPVVSKFRLPECYKVNNVAPIETKIQNFNEETLFFIFYSCTRDVRQHMAASELHSRNWRWNKKLHIWLTRDDHSTPHSLGNQYERGIYIVWDTKSWRKERKELTLHYADLDTSMQQTN